MVSFFGRCLEVKTSTILPKLTTCTGTAPELLLLTLGMCGSSSCSPCTPPVHTALRQTSLRSLHALGLFVLDLTVLTASSGIVCTGLPLLIASPDVFLCSMRLLGLCIVMQCTTAGEASRLESGV